MDYSEKKPLYKYSRDCQYSSPVTLQFMICKPAAANERSGLKAESLGFVSWNLCFNISR